MEPGMYVRIPIRITPDDTEHPRTFALAQISKVNRLAETVTVSIHDLNECKGYYPDVFRVTEFNIEDVVRCSAPKGSIVITPSGAGEVLFVSAIDASSFVSYTVREVGGRVREFLESDVKADFTSFELDPTEMLMRYEFQNPSWFASRSVVSSTLHVLNNSVYGFKELAGCRVYLLPHQVVTIVRCLEQRPVRYLLADEVGLGKTIEACSIVKIMQAKASSLRSLYVVPMSLLEQWKYELMNKFAIEAVAYRTGIIAQHTLLTFEDLKEIETQALLAQKFDIVVVDETHNVLGDEECYQRIVTLSNEIENILLLSATPIQNRRTEYLSLLRLLDPRQYRQMGLDQFTALLEKQLDIQRELFALLGDIQSYSDYAESIFDQLQALAAFLHDDRIMSMVRDINLEASDKGEQAAYRAAAYISEHYRIERRVIRNRRVLLKERMADRKIIECPYEMISLDELYGEADAIDLLIEWLSDINPHTREFTENTAYPLLSSAFSSPWALETTLTHLENQGLPVPTHLTDMVNQWALTASGELSRIDELLDECPDEIRGRLVHCLDYIEQETDITKDASFKVLVFSQYTETAQKFLEAVRTRFGYDVCRGFVHGMSQLELQDSSEAFQSSNRCRLMVCDELGGEGRNFQMADIVIHLDTPWNANVLEQRIGRLDRLGRNPERNVVSVVMYAENSLEEQLVQLWKNGMGIYTQSLSGLEIISGEVTSTVLQAIQNDVRYGLSHALPRIEEETVRMRDAVEEEQFYDMASMLFSPLTVAVERMLDIYQGKEDEIFADAMGSWADQSGFKPTYVPDSGNVLVEFRREHFSPASSVNAFMVPPDWNTYTINPRVNRKGRIVGTFNRTMAINREDLLFYAPGDPIFDAITRNAIACYKGRVCALEIDQGPISFNGLVLIWNVDSDIKPLIKRDLDPIVLAQFRTFLTTDQIVTVYPVNEKYVEVTPRDVEMVLRQKNLLKRAKHLGQRSASFREEEAPINKFMRRYPERDWKQWIQLARSACHDRAYHAVLERWDYQTAVEEARRIVSASEAANHYFGVAQREDVKVMYEAILESLRNYEVTLDSAIYMRVKKNEYR